MAVMTKTDVEAMIREVLGPELAGLRTEIEKGQRTWADRIQGASGAPSRPEPEKGIRAARFVRAMTAAKNDLQRAAAFATKWGDEVVAKAISESVFEEGGAILPEEYTAEVIELLRAQAVVRALGATIAPMNSGSLTMPYLSQGTTAYYIGEKQNITPSSLTFGQLQLSAKKLAALTPESNDLLRDAAPSVDAIVRDDLVRTMALREDLAFIRDDGTEGKPKGMRYWADAAHIFDRTQVGGLNTVATAIADLGKMVRLLEEANVPRTRCGWIMAPRTKWWLMTLLDANGNKVFWDEMQRGFLLTFPFRTTSQIPTNLVTNKSELYLGDFASLIIGENTRLIIDAFPGGAYYDGSQVVSGISTDQTVIRTLARHDFGARFRGKEIAVLTSVDWGV